MHVIFNEKSFHFKHTISVSPPISSSSFHYPLVVYQQPLVPSASSSNATSQFVSTPVTPSISRCPSMLQPRISSPPPPLLHVYKRRQHNNQTPLLITSVPAQIPESVPTSIHSMVTRSHAKTVPKAHLATNHPLAAIDLDPTTYAQASKEQKWRDAMANELDALAKNQTWTLVPITEADNVVGCKWVFKTKRRFDGSVERCKAHLVPKGYTQEESLDYTDTFSPVVKPTTIRLVLSLVVTNNWSIRQLDINNAFLHEDLQETIFMSQPPGFQDQTYPSHVCKLHKALYGLKQSPRV
jgi:Reverse transcriptase (RNA-dependent DNA polymerase)